MAGQQRKLIASTYLKYWFSLQALGKCPPCPDLTDEHRTERPLETNRNIAFSLYEKFYANFVIFRLSYTATHMHEERQHRTLHWFELFKKVCRWWRHEFCSCEFRLRMSVSGDRIGYPMRPGNMLQSRRGKSFCVCEEFWCREKFCRFRYW